MTTPGAVSFEGHVSLVSRRLYARLAGTGTPPVVFDSGSGVPLKWWEGIAGPISQETTVFTYDRANVGQSDPAPTPRASRHMADDLHALLRALRLIPPYVLVGHSLGGLNLRHFAALYPEEVTGIVLVDSLSAHATAMGHFLSLVPPDRRDRAIEIESGDNEEGADMEDGRAQLQDLPPLPDVPLVVLTAADARPPQWWPLETTVSDWPPPEADRLRIAFQGELATLTRRGRQVVVPNSGHFLHLDQPQVVIDAIRSVLQEARSRS